MHYQPDKMTQKLIATNKAQVEPIVQSSGLMRKTCNKNIYLVNFERIPFKQTGICRDDITQFYADNISRN